MTPPSAERSDTSIRVALAVQPPLLADALAGVLASAGVEPVVLTAPTDRRFDLLITSGEVLGDAEVIVHVHPDRPGPVATSTGREPASTVDSLPELLGVVSDLAAGRRPGQARTSGA